MPCGVQHIWRAFFGLVLVAAISAFATPHGFAQEKRIALVIGNGNYAEINSLSNPLNDARLMRTTLQSLGFEVIYRENVDKRAMERVIGDFATKLYDAGRETVSLVYYAGHGVQSNGENFLLPTDVPLRRETDLRLNAIRAGDILAQMEGAQSRVKIVILDACRDNPFELTFRSATRSGGLADMRLGNAEFFIAYAATAGNVAWDGDGDATNSPYALALSKYLAMPDTEISETFRVIRNEVANTTRGRQLPEARTTLRQQFYFSSKSSKPAQQVATADIKPGTLITPPPIKSAPQTSPRDPSQPANSALDERAKQGGAAITVSDLIGRWCDVTPVSRNGKVVDFSMKVGAKRLEILTDGHAATYLVKGITQISPDTLQMVSDLKKPQDVSEFGEFGEDGRTMTYLRARTGNSEWTTYNRRYKKC